MKCPTCGAPAGPSAPDGDFKYRPPENNRDGYAAGFAAALAMLQNPSRDLETIVARVLGERICEQFRLEKIGEGDKMRAYFTLPGKALDFSAASADALRAAASALADSAGREGE